MNPPPPDDILMLGMLSEDPAIAAVAKRIFDKKHANDPQPPEPAHCSECFEGCPNCQPATTPASADKKLAVNRQ